MAGPDEPTPGELNRNIQRLTTAVELLSQRVMTVELYQAERRSIDLRIDTVGSKVTDVVSDLKAEIVERKTIRDRDRAEVKADRDRVQSFRRQIVFAVCTSLIAPVLVGVVFLLIAKGGGS